MSAKVEIREIQEAEFGPLGRLLVTVYSQLPGFPAPSEQPKYYEMLANIGSFTQKKDAKVLVALLDGELVGGVVYFGDMAEYGSGGTATQEKEAAGIRLLGVDPARRGLGVGGALTRACIELARRQERSEVILHTTNAMEAAWSMYERMGFQRSADLDFMQGNLAVFGFRLARIKGFTRAT